MSHSVALPTTPPFFNRGGVSSADIHTLTLFHGKPGVETTTFRDGNNQVVDTQQRICHRSRIFLELKR